MDRYLNTAYDVTQSLFGPDSGIPTWAWFVVIVALFFKVMVPERKTAAQLADERDAAMAGELDGRKGKKGKKK